MLLKDNSTKSNYNLHMSKSALPDTLQRAAFISQLVASPQIKAIGQTELNTSNPEEVLQLAAQKRKKRFLQAMAKLYF